jgi:hypothetical protein
VGHRYTEEQGHVWEGTEAPSSMRQGKVVTVRFTAWLIPLLMAPGGGGA